MRDEILGLWAPYVRRQTGLPPAQARALAWMLTVAAWGVTDLVEDGTLSAAVAKDLLATLVDAAVTPHTRAHGHRARSTRRTS